MLLLLSITLCMAGSKAAGSPHLGKVEIKGSGTVGPDHTSLDIHIEIMNTNVSKPSKPQATQRPPAVSLLARKEQTNFFNKPVFGKETAQEFIKSALESHNRYRAIHNSPPLKLNSKMSQDAEAFARKLAQMGAKNKSIFHEDQLVLQKGNEDENLAAGGSSMGGLTAHGAVKSWYNEVCSYDWSKGGYKPQSAHFMQLIWKGTTDLGIGRAEGVKNGQPYTYVVARYKPAITFDSLKNVFRGKFNPSLCRDVISSSQSDLAVQEKTISRFKPKETLTGRFLSQKNHFPNKLAMLQPLPRNYPLPSTTFNFKKQGSYSGTYLPYYGNYRNGFLKILNNNPYNQPQQKSKFGNAWSVFNDERRPLPKTKTSSVYFPKQDEVLEEFLEGDDPTGKPFSTGNGNNRYLRKKGSSPSLIPVMNSVDAEIDDDENGDIVENVLDRKAHVPKHSW